MYFILILQETLGYKLFSLFNQIQEIGKNDFKDLGITRGNYVVLYFINENHGITQAELADITKKDRNVVTKTIDKLEEKGFVKRVRGEKDRRSFTLFLTDSGKQIVNDYWHILIDGEAELLGKLTAEEQKMFLMLTDKLVK